MLYVLLAIDCVCRAQVSVLKTSFRNSHNIQGRRPRLKNILNTLLVGWNALNFLLKLLSYHTLYNSTARRVFLLISLWKHHVVPSEA